MKILVFGSNGQLGLCLKDKLDNSKNNNIFLSHKDVDITNFKETKDCIQEICPDIVINTAAYTNVEMSEKEPDQANYVNNLAVKNISETCKQVQAFLIHISTDYVFDGNFNSPYKENDETKPQNIYGITKLNGEQAIESSGCKYLIIRSAWIFSEYGNNFLTNMLQLGKKNKELKVVGDQMGCPTYAQDIACAINKIISVINLDKFKSCIYHYCGNNPCSWFDFAEVIFKEASSRKINVPDIIYKIDTSEYPTLAKRPLFSILDCSKIYEDFGVEPSNWRNGVVDSINKLIS